MVNIQATGKAVKRDSTKGKAFEGSGEAWRGEGNFLEKISLAPPISFSCS